MIIVLAILAVFLFSLVRELFTNPDSWAILAVAAVTLLIGAALPDKKDRGL